MIGEKIEHLIHGDFPFCCFVKEVAGLQAKAVSRGKKLAINNYISKDSMLMARKKKARLHAQLACSSLAEKEKYNVFIYLFIYL